MAGELPDPGEILEQTDWTGLEHAYGPAFPDTPVKLSGLASTDRRAVRIGLNHLWDELVHQGTLYSATAPAALYVASLVGDERDRDWNQRRAQLLDWLAEVAYTVSDEMERKVSAWCGYSHAAKYGPLYPWVRDIRPRIFHAVDACIHDSDPAVRRAALAAMSPSRLAPTHYPTVGVRQLIMRRWAMAGEG